jgi:hypothetical protein
MTRMITLFALIFATSLNAQTIEITDPNFAMFLQNSLPACMTGNALDTLCASQSQVVEMNLSGMNISDINGIQYFTNLTSLYCHNNNISSLAALPPNLESFICSNNNLSALPELPSSLLYLSCGENELTNLPNLPPNLIELMCYDNALTAMPAMPNSLSFVVASNNQISTMGALSESLSTLDLNNNMLTELPELPSTLIGLSCSNNLLTSLPALPNLVTLHAANNQISCLPFIPHTINLPILSFVFLTLEGNPFTCLPNYTAAMNDDLLEMPLCTSEPNINPFGCPVAAFANTPKTEITFEIYPNPCANHFIITTPNASAIQVFDAQGRAVLIQITTSPNETKVDLLHAQAGVYYLFVEIDGERVVRKVVRG